MRARVYAKDQNTYYISEVYAEINRAGSWYIVDDFKNTNKVILIPYLDLSTDCPYKVNIEFIDYNLTNAQWINLDNKQVSEINKKLTNSKALYYCRGYKKILEKTNILLELLEIGTADKDAFGLTNLSTKLSDWNYIESQADIDHLMNEYGGFHDSVLKEMSYISGDCKEADGGMRLNPVGNKNVRLIFNSDWADEIEIILLSPRICHLVPGEENIMSVLYETSMFIKDYAVYFYDSFIKDIPNDYDGTYFKSLGLMWRYVDK